VQSAVTLLAAAARLTNVECQELPAGHKLLDGTEAVFDAECEMIWLNRDTPSARAAFYLAHEYAHVWLHRDYARCAEPDLVAGNADNASLTGAQRVEGYSLLERREREANVFAQEFLLPADLLRGWYLEWGLGATEIARRVGVEIGVVYHQLARALLTPTIPTTVGDEMAGPTHGLDPSQEAAACVAHGPFLLEAGPGTGKTRTLVARITHLLGQGVPPTSILALTFSNKAAEEMRTRVAAIAPDAAPRIWMGTFHAFGLELLRKYDERLGLDKPGVLDPVDAVAVLERGLTDLNLEHYQNLYEPTTYLADILAAISRAKDELVEPAAYEGLAAAMRAAASTPEEVTAAEKAREVARVYAYYQEQLVQAGQLDFGDLIARAVALLRAHPDVRAAVRQTYGHVLVDEYQDVNRASAILLRELAGDGRGLWIVGDARQAIYRFRGAAPVNMRLFATDDYPGAVVQTLGYNYRSQPLIVATVAEMAPQMRATAGLPFAPWHPSRTDTGGCVRLQTAADDEAERALIAQEIERQHDTGVAYRDQAVLCRTHTTLARVAAHLEAAGVPVLYLGNLFERPEVRDLLALVSLAADPHGSGLVRVATLPEYNIPLSDVRALFALARERNKPFPGALALAAGVEDISPAGQEGIARLARHLDRLCYGPKAWTLLVAYLFDRSAYIRDVLSGDTVADQQRRLAVYQLLQFAHDQRRANRETGVDPKRTFLRYIRRLEALGEERALRQAPEWASGLDAVRLLTVHAAKGLEFRAVYVPALAHTYFPLTERRDACPPPAGMLAQGDAEAHEEEEECLFFVALSRARDNLLLSYAARYGKTSRRPSPLLPLIAEHAPLPPPVTEQGKDENEATAPGELSKPPPLEGPRPVLAASALHVYMDCPRKFYYEYRLGLGGRREDSAYVQFHQCVYAVVRWIRQERATGHAVDDGAAEERLAAEWAEHGPCDHAYAAMYHQQARSMVQRAVRAAVVRGRGRAEGSEWDVTLAHGRVAVEPDNVEVIDHEGGQTVVVQRLRTGRISKAEREEPIYGLYHKAASQVYPEATCKVQAYSLSTGEEENIVLKDRSVDTRLKKYDAAFAGILHDQFPAQPDGRRCPRCPHYYICPSGGEASPASRGG
jgi:DNA helicase-2/ATP-dependent DNA helicase PcrA